MVLMNNASAPVAMSQTPEFEVSPGDEKTLRVRAPLESVAPGEFSIKLSLVGGDPRGGAATGSPSTTSAASSSWTIPRARRALSGC